MFNKAIDQLQAEKAELERKHKEAVAVLDAGIMALQCCEEGRAKGFVLEGGKPVPVTEEAQEIRHTGKGETKSEVLRILANHKEGLLLSEIARRCVPLRSTGAVYSAVKDMQLRGAASFEFIKVAAPHGGREHLMVSLISVDQTKAIA